MHKLVINRRRVAPKSKRNTIYSMHALAMECIALHTNTYTYANRAIFCIHHKYSVRIAFHSCSRQVRIRRRAIMNNKSKYAVTNSSKLCGGVFFSDSNVYIWTIEPSLTHRHTHETGAEQSPSDFFRHFRSHTKKEALLAILILRELSGITSDGAVPVFDIPKPGIIIFHM